MNFPKEFYLSFFLGGSVGVLFVVIYTELNNYHKPARSGINYDNLWENVLTHSAEKLPPVVDKPHQPIIFNDMQSSFHKGGDAVAKSLAKKVRVLCWIMTQPKTLHIKARAVKDTWAKRCNVALFISSVEDKEFPVIGVNVQEGRQNLWLKTRAAWKYVYENHLNDADWFIKADDDSFIILENLRYFISVYNSSDPHYFGRYFTPFGGYNSGGAGYVFSKETLRRFYSVLKDPYKCKLKSGAEDAEVGICLATVGVRPGDTRDELGRETFHPFAPEYHLIPGSITANNWLHSYNKWKVVTGPDCCSDHTIAFHYIPPKMMYTMEYFIYHLHAHGLHND